VSTETRTPADHTGNTPSAKMASRFAYAAGYTGILGNLFLIALYALLVLQGGSPAGGTLLGSAFRVAGSASDLLGSLSTAFMIPVALFLGGRLPRRRYASRRRAASRPWRS
jgi:hypothetical protein